MAKSVSIMNILWHIFFVFRVPAQCYSLVSLCSLPFFFVLCYQREVIQLYTGQAGVQVNSNTTRGVKSEVLLFVHQIFTSHPLASVTLYLSHPTPMFDSLPFTSSLSAS